MVICHAGILVEDNHGHAVSSQSIVRHDQPTHQLNAHYTTPILTHTVQSAPLVHQSYYQQAPVVHAAPLVHHGAPLVHHSAPLVHTAPISVGHETHEAEQHVRYDRLN